MSSLTSVERLVLESLGSAPKDLKSLMADTQLELRFLVNVLHALTLRSVITLTDEGYSPNRHLPAQEIASMNDESSRREEALELFNGIHNMGLRKAWVSEKDRKILKAILKNLEDFMQTLPAAPKNAPLHEYTLVMWGEDQYGSTIRRLIGGMA